MKNTYNIIWTATPIQPFIIGREYHPRNSFKKKSFLSLEVTATLCLKCMFCKQFSLSSINHCLIDRVRSLTCGRQFSITQRELKMQVTPAQVKSTPAASVCVYFVDYSSNVSSCFNKNNKYNTELPYQMSKVLWVTKKANISLNIMWAETSLNYPLIIGWSQKVGKTIFIPSSELIR